MRFSIQLAFLGCIFALLGVKACASEADDAEYFEKKIRPIFAEHCISCHGEKKQKGGLRLDSKKGWEKGGETGRAIVPKKSKDSLLIKMVAGAPGTPPQMPPEKVLPKELSDELVKWVDAGAFDPRTAEPEVAAAKTIDWKAAAEFWAFKPVVSPTPPEVKDASATSPIDRFVLAKLEEKALHPNTLADKRTLLRRATYDLTGLPPTLDEIKAFETDASPDAFAKVVERLLASPQYGENQARSWLDLARYGEDQADVGKDGALNHAWRYRDWVVEAFNKDLPYERFVKLQLAADLIEGTDPLDKRALGFLGLGNIYARPNDLDRKRADEWDDRLDTLSRTFFALTVSCARCHDHKYDPIPTQDYYSLAGILASSKDTLVPIAPADQVATYAAAKAKRDEADQKRKDFLQLEIDRLALEKTESFPEYALAIWSYKVEKVENPNLKMDEFATARKLDPKIFRGLDTYLTKGGGRSQKLQKWPGTLPAKGAPKDVTAEAKELAEEFKTMVKENFTKPYKKRNLDIQNDLFGAEKGVIKLDEKNVVELTTPDWKTQYAPFQDALKVATAAMPPEPPQCHGVVEGEKLADLKVYLRGNPGKQGELAPRRFLRVIAGTEQPKIGKTSGRLELANAIATPTNPLTARVMANRIWQQHFGRGIVGSASNFGQNGERPTHPELLDYLATQLVKEGWSIKKLHREIMLTQAYQRASTGNIENESTDPENRLLWRMPRHRLTVEAFRDSILSVSGNLDRTLAGQSGEIDDLKFVRRTVYGRVSRHDLSALLRLFDFPAPNITSDRRTDTTLPQQALFLMNSPFILAQSKVLAARIAAEPSAETQVKLGYQLALMRAPSAAELDRTVKFLAAQDEPTSGKQPAVPARLERFTQALLACNEFFFVD